MRNPITQQELKQRFNYFPATGLFRYKEVPEPCIGRISIGDIAGHEHKKGVRIIINGVSYGAHKLAWLYFYGEYPNERIDHRNRDNHNNRIKNLRKAKNGQNRANSLANKNTIVGLKGVTLSGGSKINPYHAQITIAGKCRHIGLFPTAEQAHKAYCEEARKAFKKFHYHG